MHKSIRSALWPILALTLTWAVYAQPRVEPADTRILRFPATNGKQVVFSYAGQLYGVGIDGGVARRLTNTPGYAVFPRFSADGTLLAFTAQYDGNTEVYEMPAEGGVPKRLTFSATLDRDDVADRMGPNNLVIGWKNTQNEVVFRSRGHSFDPFIGELLTVGLNAEVPGKIPVPRGGFASYSPDDTKLAYNRVFREFRTWKAYRGGMADDIWVLDLKTGTTENITNNPAQDIIPMWGSDGKIYFLSDRDGRLNLFSYDLKSKATKQLTTFKDFDIKFPSLGGNKIVFEQAGQIWIYDLASAQAKALTISVKEDLASGRGGLVNVSKFVTSLSLAPDGKRAVVEARGDLFTVPAKYGATRNLTDTSGVHERDASWSPDGKWIAYVSDATGENELYVRPQDGHGDPVKLTSGADTYYFAPHWSPDSGKLLWGDRAQRLRYLDIATKAVTVVETSTAGEYQEYAWSPDSQWISYIRPAIASKNRVVLYSLASKKSTDVTDGWYGVSVPVFSDDGKFLLFASARDFHPVYSDTEWDHAYINMERVYLVALAKDTPSPFAPKSDEVNGPSDDKKPDDKAADGDKDKKDTAKKVVATKVDLDGLGDRVIGLPITPANYGNMRMLDDKVYYSRTLGGGTDEDDAKREEHRALVLFDLKEKKETELGEFTGFEISADGKKMLVAKAKEYAIIDLPTAKIELKEKLDLSSLEQHLDRHAEWNQIYDECWRQMRDYFYAPNMHGVDWRGQHDKYAALLPYVETRNDLTYLIGELISELHIGHSYVAGGDRVEAPRVKTGLLGAVLSRDPQTKAYRIDRILPGQNWDNSVRSPLTEMGVNVSAGDYILAVNGKPVRDLENIYAALIGTVDEQVVLKVNSKPQDEGAHDVTVIPIGDESPLYYYDWVQKNIAYVNQKTNGQVGYIHIPDMGPDGLNEFAKHFYPQLNKHALIVDDRGNGGGNVSPMIIDRLRRELALIEMARNRDPIQSPPDMIVGPMVCLINEFSASDGDLFPFRFRIHHLGKLVGKRTWGGVVGIRESLPLTDGGSLFKPEFAPYARDGSNWIIEGHGVDPDIVVDNDPTRELKGEDQQLDKAIEVILEEMKTKGGALPPVPAYPNKK